MCAFTLNSHSCSSHYSSPSTHPLLRSRRHAMQLRSRAINEDNPIYSPPAANRWGWTRRWDCEPPPPHPPLYASTPTPAAAELGTARPPSHSPRPPSSEQGSHSPPELEESEPLPVLGESETPARRREVEPLSVLEESSEDSLPDTTTSPPQPSTLPLSPNVVTHSLTHSLTLNNQDRSISLRAEVRLIPPSSPSPPSSPTVGLNIFCY